MPKKICPVENIKAGVIRNKYVIQISDRVYNVDSRLRVYIPFPSAKDV